MDLTGALALARFLRDGAALLLWGGSLYLVLVPKVLRAELARSCARSSIATILTVLAAVLALLPIQAAFLGNGWPDAFDGATLRALLFGTTMGTAWLVQGAASIGLLAIAVLPCPWRIHAAALLSATLLVSLTVTGHAAMHEGWLGVAHRANDLLHLLAVGFWFGALAQLLPTLGMVQERGRHSAAIVALRRFSQAGHVAVALVIVTGTLNAALILGGWPTDWTFLYATLLVAKILLVAGMTALALINRYAFVPQLRDAPARTIQRIRNATLAELVLGSGAIALVALFGLLDPS